MPIRITGIKKEETASVGEEMEKNSCVLLVGMYIGALWKTVWSFLK